MRFEIQATPTGDFGSSPEIPDIDLCQLQGGNGIGKSLAVRLLQLVTGAPQPWSGRHKAWETLRTSLGETTIRIQGLRTSPAGPKTSELVWELSPDDWPETPTTLGPWLSAQLDGQLVGPEEIRRLLFVGRVAGDESLAQSLADDVRGTGRVFEEQQNAFVQGRNEWDALLRSIDQVSGVMNSKSLGDLADEIVAAQSSSKEAQHEHSVSQERRLALAEASRIDELIRLVDEELPGLRSREEQLETNRANLEKELRDLAEKTAEVRANSAREQEIISELKHAESLYERRQSRLSGRVQEIKVALRFLGLSSELTTAEVAKEQTQVRSQLSEVTRRRQVEDKAGLVIQVSEELERPIARAIQQGLEDEAIAFLEGTEISVAQLGTGIDVQREHLRDDLSTDAMSLQTEEQALKSRSGWLRELRDSIRLRDKAMADLEETRLKISDLLDKLQGTTKEQYTDLVRRRESVLENFTNTTTELTEVHDQVVRLTESGSAADLRSSLESLLAGENTSLGLDVLIGQAQERVDNAKACVDSALLRLRAATQALAHAREQVMLGTARLADPEFSWLASGGIEMPESNQPVEQQADILHKLAISAESLRNELIALGAAGDEIGQELKDLAWSLERQEAHTSSERNRYATAVIEYFQRRFTEELRTDVIVDALFDRGLNVTLILRELSVSWDTPAGEKRNRPLEAFSSGEHAFAYTRVKLETLKTHRALNSVVFLDEFGAYIASDRLQQLTDYVQRHALGSIADQIVIILPRTSAVPKDDAFTAPGYFAERPSLEEYAR